MPATFPRMDPALFAKLKAGDESALEQLFRERYAAMVEEAKALLHGDGASAARGVEDVFVQVWKNRAEFETPEALDGFLHEAIAEAATRTNTRHSIAQEFAKHEHVAAPKATVHAAPDANAAWEKVKIALHANAGQHAREMASHSRREAAGHVASIAARRSMKPVFGIGGALVIVLGVFGWMIARGREAADLTEGLTAPDVHQAATAMGELSKVSLSDGSSVQLGPDSRLKIPSAFSGSGVRGVELEGTAVFTVAPGQKQRFVVRAANATIASTGTEFVVRSYPDESDVAVEVHTGDVTVEAKGATHPLTNGAALVVAKDNTMHDASAAEREQRFGWTDGMVVANDVPLKDVILLSKRWFGLQLFVEDTSLLSRKVSVRAKVGDGAAAIASLEKGSTLRREWKGTNMVLRDAGSRK